MNILFIGPYRQPDGWGIAAKEYLLALLRTSNNVCCQPIFMGNGKVVDLPESIKQAENNRCSTYDVVIQNVLPHLAHKNAKFGKNILLLHTESTFKWTHWPMYIDTMDEVWVPSSADLYNLTASGVSEKTPIKVIGIPTDTDKYMSSYDNINLPKEKFYFYFIGEYIQRKNIMDIVTAFHLEFDLSENVGLVLKLNKAGHNAGQLAHLVTQDITAVKSKLKLYKKLEFYKPEYVIYDKLTDNQLYGLHEQCNCFIMPSSGESWSLPTFDALGFGKTPIVTDKIGPCDYITEQNGYRIDSLREQCMVTDAPIPYLYNSKESWLKPSVPALRKCMREAYTQTPEQIETKTYQGYADLKQFSHTNIGAQIDEVLNA